MAICAHSCRPSPPGDAASDAGFATIPTAELCSVLRAQKVFAREEASDGQTINHCGSWLETDGSFNDAIRGGVMDRKWLDWIVQAFRDLGGKTTYSQLYRKLREIRPEPFSPE